MSARTNGKPDAIFADFDLAARLEAATVAMLTAFERVGRRMNGSPVALQNISTGKMLFAGVGSPVNHAVGMGMGKPVTSAEMDRVEKFFRSRKTPIEIMVCPLVDIAFPQLLVKRGYRPTEFENVLVLSLRDWKPQQPPAKKSKLTIRKNTPAQAALATKVIADGFAQMAMPPEIRAPLEDFQRLPKALCYMAYADGVPVSSAAGMISPKQKVALLFGTSTLPKFRNMGAQSLLLQGRLKEAVAAGCELATISTFPGTTSQHNAERAGFRVAYTKTTYVLD
ncbi:MAG: acetyltransferase [Candidatus Angelobacter sp.]|nr:acetyltransferase [Candidatus Angelobacter sp.]